MSAIAATPVPASGYVRVEVDFSDIPSARKAWVSRVQGLTVTALRDGDPAPLSGGRCILYDTEIPLDSPYIYWASTSLNVNPDMESGVAEWLDTSGNGTNCTVVQSFDYYVPGEGRASLKMTPTTTFMRAVSEYVPATAGTTYTFTGRLMVPTFWGGGIGIQVYWYNGTTFLSSAGAANDFWPSPGEWGSYGFAAVAPASTTNMRIVAIMANNPPKTQVMYVDEMYITRSGTSVGTGSTTLAGNGNGWWKDPLHPATMQQLVMSLGSICATTSAVVYGGISAVPTRAGDSAALDVYDTALPVATWATRKGPRAAMRVGTLSIADRDAVLALHSSGAPLLLQLPSTYNLPDHYQLHGDLAEGFLGPDQRKPWRTLQSDFVQVPAPVGPAEGVFGVRYMDINRWSTYLAAAATGGGTYDTYTRSATDTWTANDTGQAYTLVGAATSFDIGGGVGTITATAASSTYEARLDGISLADLSLRVRLGQATTLTGTTSNAQRLRLRRVDNNNTLDAQINRFPGGGVILTLNNIVGGSVTVTASAAVPGAGPQDDLDMYVLANGSSFTVWVWKTNTTRPLAPLAGLTATHLAAGAVTLSLLTDTGVTGYPMISTWDELQVTNLNAGTAQNTWWDILQGEGHV